MPVNRLVNANQSSRCQHLKANGLRRGSPARHGRPYCCFHDSALRRNQEFVLPIIEDAASLQLALNPAPRNHPQLAARSLQLVS